MRAVGAGQARLAVGDAIAIPAASLNMHRIHPSALVVSKQPVLLPAPSFFSGPQGGELVGECFGLFCGPSASGVSVVGQTLRALVWRSGLRFLVRVPLRRAVPSALRRAFRKGCFSGESGHGDERL